MRLSRLLRAIVPVLAIATAAVVVAPAGPAQAEPYLYEARATNRDGRAEHFWTGTKDVVLHEWATVPGGPYNSGYWPLNGMAISSGLGATHNEDGRLEIFGRGTDGALWHNWQQWRGGDWSGWYRISGLIEYHSNVGAWYDSNTGTIRVQVVGVDGILHIMRQLHENCCWNSVWE
jgi:hypothetical protein